MRAPAAAMSGARGTQAAPPGGACETPPGGARGRWSVGRLALVLYPAAAGAMMVNLFFAGLLSRGVGLSGLSPAFAVAGGLVLGAPFAWLAARRFRRLMDQADAAP